jgi:hypothetical protein
MNALARFGTYSLILLALSYTPTLAQAPDSRSPVAGGALADKLRTWTFRMAALLRSRDAQGTLDLYGDTAHFVHVDNGEVIPWPRLSDMIRRYFATARSNPISIVGEPGVRIADAHNAVLYVRHSFDSTNGRPAHAGVWTGVLQRFPDGWRIVHSHSSDLVRE